MMTLTIPYLDKVLDTFAPTSDKKFTRDAAEHAISMDLVALTGNLEADIKVLTDNYDLVCRCYHRYLADQNTDILEANFGLPITELTTGY